MILIIKLIIAQHYYACICNTQRVSITVVRQTFGWLADKNLVVYENFEMHNRHTFNVLIDGIANKSLAGLLLQGYLTYRSM